MYGDQPQSTASYQQLSVAIDRVHGDHGDRVDSDAPAAQKQEVAVRTFRDDRFSRQSSLSRSVQLV
jgi:hypothetical protein